jgi:hypothetical protein
MEFITNNIEFIVVPIIGTGFSYILYSLVRSYWFKKSPSTSTSVLIADISMKQLINSFTLLLTKVSGISFPQISITAVIMALIRIIRSLISFILFFICFFICNVIGSVIIVFELYLVLGILDIVLLIFNIEHSNWLLFVLHKIYGYMLAEIYQVIYLLIEKIKDIINYISKK